MAEDISTHGNHAHAHLAASTRATTWPPMTTTTNSTASFTTELLNAIVSPVISTAASSTGGGGGLADVLYTWMANVSAEPPISLLGGDDGDLLAAQSPPPPPDLDGGGGDLDAALRLEHAPQLSHSALVKVYVLSVMAILSLLGNILTMWNIYKTRIARRNSRHSWSAIYSLIFHLSIADVLVTGFCIIGEAAWCYTVQWLADELTCKLVKLFQMFSLYLSTYVLVLIGVDRWIAVKYPMKSLNMAKRCYRLLGGTYILSFLLSLPQFFIFHVARGPFIEEFHQCVTHGFYTAEWQEQLYTTFTLVFTFLLPLCILFGTYLSTFRTISSSEKMFQGSKLAAYSTKPSAQTNRQRLIHKAKMKSLRISVVIIIAFLVCWTPYNVMMIIFMFLNPDKRLSEDLHSAIFFFGMSNSLVNPLIYGAFHLCPMRRTASKTGTHNANHSLNRGDSQRTPSMLTAVTQIDNNGRQIRTYHRQSSYYRTQSSGSGSGSCKEHVGLLPVATTTPTSSLIRKTSSIRAAHYSTTTTGGSHSGYPHHPHLYQGHPQHHHHHQLHHQQHQLNQQQHQKQQQQQHHSHSTSLICKEETSREADPMLEATTSPPFGTAAVACNSSPLSTVVFTYDMQHGGGVTATAKKYSQSQSASALNVLGAAAAKCMPPNGSQGRNGSSLFGSAPRAAHLDRSSYIDENVSSV